MENTVFKKVFDVNEWGDRILIAIHKRGNKYNYTVADGDGEGGYEETLVPFMKSKYKYDSIDDALEDAKYAYSDYIYQKNLEAYEGEYENYKKEFESGNIDKAEFDYLVMSLSEKYNV